METGGGPLRRLLSAGTIGGELRAALMEMDARKFSVHLIGGFNRAELPIEPRGLLGRTKPFRSTSSEPRPRA